MVKLWQKMLDKGRLGKHPPQITFKKQPSPQASPQSEARPSKLTVPRDSSNFSDDEYFSNFSRSSSSSVASSTVNGETGHRRTRSGGSSFLEGNSFSRHDHITSVEEIPDIEGAYQILLSMYPNYQTLVMPFDDLRSLEYSHLDMYGLACFDYSGAGLFTHLQAESEDHPIPKLPSFSPKSNRSKNLALHALQTNQIEQGTIEYELRERVLDHFHTYEYEYGVVFTPNAGHALQLLTDTYPFCSQNSLVIAYDFEDEFLISMSKAASKAGSSVIHAPFSFPDFHINVNELRNILSSDRGEPNQVEFAGAVTRGLFVIPLQSRVTGTRQSLQWINEAQKRGWHVLLDASALSPGDALDLQLYKPDFVLTSYYKVFGEDPSGFGCLLVRRGPSPTSNTNPHSVSLPRSSTDLTKDDASSDLSICGSKTKPAPTVHSSHSFTSTPQTSPLHSSTTLSSPSTSPPHLSSQTSHAIPHMSTSGRHARQLSTSSFPEPPREPSPLDNQASAEPESAHSVPDARTNGSRWNGTNGLPPAFPTAKLALVNGNASIPTAVAVSAAGSVTAGSASAEELGRDSDDASFDDAQAYNYSRVSSFGSVGGTGLVDYEDGGLECRGLEQVKDIGHGDVSRHIEALMEFLIQGLRRLKHPGIEGSPLVEIYGPTRLTERGATIAFNVIDWKWEKVPPRLIHILAKRQNLSLSIGTIIKPVPLVPPSPKPNSGPRPLIYRPEPIRTRQDTLPVLSASLGLVSNFEDVYRLWVFVAQFLNPEFVYKEMTDFQNQQFRT